MPVVWACNFLSTPFLKNCCLAFPPASIDVLLYVFWKQGKPERLCWKRLIGADWGCFKLAHKEQKASASGECLNTTDRSSLCREAAIQFWLRGTQSVLESRAKALWALNAPCGAQWKRHIERRTEGQAASEGEVKPGCNYSCPSLSAEQRTEAPHFIKDKTDSRLTFLHCPLILDACDKWQNTYYQISTTAVVFNWCSFNL